MRPCPHGRWLGISTGGTHQLLWRSNRCELLLSGSTCVQHPSLIVLVGSTSKLQALRELTSSRQTVFRGCGEIHLHVDAALADGDRPVLYADGVLPKTNSVVRPYQSSTATCHEENTTTIRNASMSVQENANNIYYKLLQPFADVFCLFSADFGGLRGIARHVSGWLGRPKASTLPAPTYPRLAIVIECTAPTKWKEIEAERIFLRYLAHETAESLFKCFSGVEIIAILAEGKVSSGARHRYLKERLLDASDAIRDHRRDADHLFSSTHFCALFRLASQWFAERDEPFDVIRATRLANPVGAKIYDHIEELFDYVSLSSLLFSFALPVISSSLLLDTYPPDSHAFHPQDVIRSLYRDLCRRISQYWHRRGTEVVPYGIHTTLVDYLCAGLADIRAGLTAISIHRQTLRKYRSTWAQIFSNSTCLSCLRRRPQYRLPCGHYLCQNCVILFGEQLERHSFNLNRCHLCGSHMVVTIRVHPPTAGATVLCFDGGGVRGLIPLQFLEILQRRIGLPISVTRLFNVQFGTSSGGLIALGLSYNGWSISECMRSFTDLSAVAFRKRNFLCIPFVSRPLEFVASLLFDSRYPARNIEEALQHAFGPSSYISDCSYATRNGIYLGIPVASVSGPSLCLFTSYNGVGRGRNSEYFIIRPERKELEARLWEIARSASAAPWFFKPKSIQGVGTYQDAGVLRNNPISTALSELKELFPNAEEPDLVLSLGTGETKNDPHSPRRSISQARMGGCVQRVLRASWKSMRGSRDWQSLVHYGPLELSGKFFRMDVEFEGALPGLDDIKSIPAIMKSVYEDRMTLDAVDRIARSARAALFYFELDSVPRRMGGEYLGTGVILCKLPRGDPAYDVLMSLLDNAVFSVDGTPLEKGHGSSEEFRLPLTFRSKGKLLVHLQEAGFEPCNISGSPLSIAKIEVALEIHNCFGRSDHNKRKSSMGYLPPLKRQRKALFI